MDYDQIRNELTSITEIASTLPEQFQLICFEILLKASLGHLQALSPQQITPDAGKEGYVEDVPGIEPIPIKTALRVFMQRRDISIEDIRKVVMYADEDIHFLKEPSKMNITEGQSSWALLLALKNAILEDNMEADPEDIRSICKAKGFYDMNNFAKNFKREPYSGYFKNPLEPQGEAQLLDTEGEIALATLINRYPRGNE